MEKQKKSVGTIALVILLLIVTIISLVLATYAWAKYTTTTPTQTANAVVAKWNVAAGVNGTAQWSKTFNHVVTNKMAPGTNGVIPITVDATGSEVCVHYEVYITGIENKPTHVKFYEATGTTGAFVQSGTMLSDAVNAINVNETSYSGEVKIFDGYLGLTGDTHNSVPAYPAQKTTRYLMWDWPYARNAAEYDAVTDAEYDQVDTNEGMAAATMNISFKIVMTQVDPNSAVNHPVAH